MNSKELKEKLNRYVEDGFLTCQTHKRLGLIIFNYTDKATYEKKWDEITLNNRSRIYDADYNVIVPGMSKFFNFGQYSPEKQKEIAEWKITTLTEKADGCLVTIFPFAEELVVASKCSFDNFVTKATYEILRDSKITAEALINSSAALVCEVIHPATKQIVDYGDTKELRVITSFNIESKQENDWESTKFLCAEFNLKYVEEQKMSMEEILKWMKTADYTKEGFVLRNSITDERCKFKSEEYLKVASIRCKVSPECFMNNAIDFANNGKDWKTSLEEMLMVLPDELQNDGKAIIKDIVDKFNKKMQKYQKDYEDTKNLSDKELGLSDIPKKPIIFQLRKGKSIDLFILKEVRSESSK